MSDIKKYIVRYYCNACGTPFAPEHKKARWCSDVCKLAGYNAHRTISVTDPSLTAEQIQKAAEITKKIEDVSGMLDRVLNMGINPTSKHITEADPARTGKRGPKPKGPKVEKPPVNDKQLISGEKGIDHARDVKKKNKKRKAKKED